MNLKRCEVDFLHNPTSERLCRALLLHYLAQGKPEEAKRIYRRFVEANVKTGNYALSPAMQEISEALQEARLPAGRRALFSQRQKITVEASGAVGLLMVGGILFWTGRRPTLPLPSPVPPSSHAPLTAPQQYAAAHRLMEQGFPLYHAAHYDEALSRYAGAEAIYEQLGDASMQGETCLHLAEIQTMQGDLPAAVATTKRALALCRNQPGLKATLLNGLASLEFKQGHLTESLSLYQQTFPLWKKQKFGSEYIWTLLGLGEAELEQGHPDKAEAWYRQVRQEASSLKSRDMDATIDLKFARLCLRKNNLSEAREFVQKGLSHWKSKGHSRWIAVAHHIEDEILLTEEKSVKTK